MGKSALKSIATTLEALVMGSEQVRAPLSCEGGEGPVEVAAWAKWAGTKGQVVQRDRVQRLCWAGTHSQVGKLQGMRLGVLPHGVL